MAYLKQVPKVSAAQLEALIAGKAIPPELEGQKAPQEATRMRTRNGGSREFRILDYIRTKLRKVGRNYVTRCPSCAEGGHDRGGDNLAISIEDPRKYICWAGCRREMIREAVGCPIRYRQSA
jgi:hypothetical protein